MPFTVSHPAIIMPILKHGHIDKTALIVGSMAPDFEYFIHFKPYQVYGHTLLGFLIYNLPMVILVSFIFHKSIKPSVIPNLPEWLANRVCSNQPQTFKLSLRSTVIFIYSALFGMLTHLIWDSFTHHSGAAVKWIGLNQMIEITSINLPLYKLFQHGSTVIGFIIISFYILNIKEKKRLCIKSRKEKVFYWLIVCLLSVVLMCSFIVMINIASLGGYVVSFMNAVMLSILIISVADTMYKYFKTNSKRI